MALFFETLYNHAVGFCGRPFNPHVSAANKKVSLAISSAMAIYSMPNNLQSTATILLYSVRNKFGINSVSFIMIMPLQSYRDNPLRNETLRMSLKNNVQYSMFNVQYSIEMHSK